MKGFDRNSFFFILSKVRWKQACFPCKCVCMCGWRKVYKGKGERSYYSGHVFY